MALLELTGLRGVLTHEQHRALPTARTPLASHVAVVHDLARDLPQGGALDREKVAPALGSVRPVAGGADAAAVEGAGSAQIGPA